MPSRKRCEKSADSAPGEADVDATIVYGVNDDVITDDMTVISNASCTTNCLAPVAKVLNENIGIVNGVMTTIHALTNDQTVTDVRHKDLRRARSGVENMIPTKTGAAKAVGLVLPDLKGKLDGLAIRVPTVNVSLVDLSFQAGRDTSAEEINALMKAASEEGRLKGVLAYNTLPLVSMDFNHTTQASTFDSTLTKVTAGKMVKSVRMVRQRVGLQLPNAEHRAPYVRFGSTSVLIGFQHKGRLKHLFRRPFVFPLKYRIPIYFQTASSCFPTNPPPICCKA